MPHPPRRAPRAVLLGLILVCAPLVACAPAGPVEPTPVTTEGQQTVTFPEMRAAVMAAEPRVQDTGIVENQSGAARVLTVAVVVSGDDPVTTDSLTAMLTAVRDTLPDEVDQVTFLARDDTEASHILDISVAVDGLPDALTPLYDGALTLMRGDLDAL